MCVPRNNVKYRGNTRFTLVVQVLEMHDDHDQGLAHDLLTLNAMADRRRVLRWLALTSLVPLVGCSASTDAVTGAGGAGSGGVGGAGAAGAAGSNAAGNGGSDSVGSCSKIPEETAGPYPGDASNGPNALALSGIVRSDITSSFAGVSGTAEGVPLTVTLKIVNDNDSCASLEGYAVYIWHCDRDGMYSMYTAATQNYLRGVQVTDANGTVTFTTIFPGCYSGRWPHIHFEIYKDVATAVAAGSKVATSQLAMPEAQCKEVYTATGYASSVINLAQITLATDMVFSDGASTETPITTGSISDGYVSTLTVGVSA